MDMYITRTQLACFATPRERVTAWAPAGLLGTSASAAQMSGPAVIKGANGKDATGDLAFEDPD